MTIQIEVKNKNLSVIGEPEIICGNSGYEVQFTFDAEWEKYPVKTARFLYNKHYEWQYEDVVFEGNTVAIPDVYDIKELLIGLYAGDICATTPAEIKCQKSILCCNPIHNDPPEDVYNQLVDLLNKKPDSSGVTSWNDLTDKPFGDENTIIFPETTLTFAEDEYTHTFPLSIRIVAGETYIVICNGEEYELTAVWDEFMTDTHLNDMDNDIKTGCPIAFYQLTTDDFPNNEYDECNINRIGDPGVYTVSVIKRETKTIDEQYIPNIAWDKVTFGTERETIIENFTSVAGGWADGILIPGETYIVKVNEETNSCVAEFSSDEYGDICRLPMDAFTEMIRTEVSIDYVYAKQKIRIGSMGGGETVSVYHVVKQTIGEDVLPYKTEEWTFELADGQTTTKQVVLK